MNSLSNKEEMERWILEQNEEIRQHETRGEPFLYPPTYDPDLWAFFIRRRFKFCARSTISWVVRALHEKISFGNIGKKKALIRFLSCRRKKSTVVISWSKCTFYQQNSSSPHENWWESMRHACIDLSWLNSVLCRERTTIYCGDEK